MTSMETKEVRRLIGPAFSPTGPRSLERAVEHARWFISLRWIAVVVAAFLIVVAVYFLKILPLDVWQPLAFTVVLLGALNLVCLFLLKRDVDPSFVTAFQAYGDLVLLTVLIHFSGGIENPLVLLMIFHVIIAGITLSRLQCYAVAVVATVLFSLLAWLEASETIAHYTLRIVPHYEEHGHTAHAAHDPVFASSFAGLQGTILLLTAYFVTTLAERLRQKETELSIFAERALTQSQLLERALETTGTGLAVFNSRLKPILTNRRWQAWFDGFGTDSPMGERLLGSHSPLGVTLRDGQVRVEEVELEETATDDDRVTRSGARTYHTTTAPLIDAEGHINNVVQLVRDVTDQKAAQRQMLRAGQLAAVGELAGQVAHEVNNPIAIISAKTRLLLSDHGYRLTHRTAAELKKIVELSDRVAAIASGLLFYCRPSTAIRSPLNVMVPIRRALSMVEQKLEDATVAVYDRADSELPSVNANEREIEQVFLNLFLNAMDAMPQGGTLRIEAAVVDEARDRVTIRITDSGEGMPESVSSRIFEPFFTTKPEGEGTGLGLSICQGLVQSYGGSIDVESNEGQGTTVIIRLPIHEDV